jgi:hypothetical protein
VTPRLLAGASGHPYLPHVGLVRVAPRVSFPLTALLAMGALLGTAGVRAIAQAPDDPAPSRRSRLFDDSTRLRLTLSADFAALAKERGMEKHDYPGKLSYVTARGDSVVLDVFLHTRGHFRLHNCQFPPLKVVFDREDTGHTLFAHQHSLKLVVQCRESRSYANYLIEEYLIYRVYNLVTERSFRARLAQVTYVDATGKRAAATRYGFFIEDDDRMARRNDAAVFEQKGVFQRDADFGQMGLLAAFEYLIGNTDWSVAALHNIVLIRDSAGVVYPVPYDFDWSGVIYPPYALPDPRLHLRSVRERVYRGACRSPAELATAFAHFNDRKDAIYAMYRGQEGLEPKRVEQALDYYDDFYKTINAPRSVKREFIENCQHE